MSGLPVGYGRNITTTPVGSGITVDGLLIQNGAVGPGGVNAGLIQSVTVDATAPLTGQGLVYNGTNYAPAYSPIVLDSAATPNYPQDLTKGIWYGLNTKLNAFDSTCITIGENANTNGPEDLALGWGAQTTSVLGRNIAIGRTAICSGLTDGIAMGFLVTNTQQYGIAIGRETACNAVNGIAIGRLAVASGLSTAVALGFGATASGNSSMAINGLASGDYSAAINSGICSGNNSFLFGAASTCVGNASTVIGASSSCGADNSIVMGSGTTCSGVNSVVLGNGASSLSTFSVALGSGANSGGGTNCIAIGNNADTTGTNAIRIGPNLPNSVANSISLGTSAVESLRLPDPAVGGLIVRRIQTTDTTNTIALTPAQVLGGVLEASFAGAIGVTMPTAASLDAYAQLVNNLYVDMSFQLVVAASDPAGQITYNTAAGITLKGSATPAANSGQVLTFYRTGPSAYNVFIC